jgi:tetratricopeptide (TPR) repeat protein
MFAKKFIYLIAVLIIIAVFILYLFAYRSSTNTPGEKNFVERIRDENKAGLDSLQAAIDNENNLNFRIKKSIETGDFKTAFALIDSLPPFGKTETTHVYTGMIAAAQKKYAEAIDEYTEAIKEDPYSNAVSLRAEVYVEMNRPEFALKDYKSIFEYNKYFSRPVANTFLLLHEKDSALKYYQIYLMNYPDDTAIQQRVKSLKSN